MSLLPTRVGLNKRILEALGRCVDDSLNVVEDRAKTSRGPAVQREVASRRRAREHVARQRLASSPADRLCAETIRVKYVQHLKKSWMQNYSYVTNSRRALLSYIKTKRKAGEMGSEAYTVAVNYFSIIGMAQRCEAVFRMALDDGVRPTQQMYENLAACFAKTGGHLEVRRILREVLASSHHLFTERLLLSYTTALHKAGLLLLAVRLSSIILTKLGAIPEFYTHPLLCCTSREQSNIILQEMRDAGVEISQIMRNAVLHSTYRRMDVEYAWRIYHEMLRAGETPTFELTTSLLSVHRKAGDDVGLQSLMTELLRAGREPAPMLFTMTIGSSLSRNEHTNARLGFAVATSWRMAEGLRVHSKSLILAGLRGSYRELAMCFDARPLGKYTFHSLRIFLFGMIHCLALSSSAGRVVMMHATVGRYAFGEGSMPWIGRGFAQARAQSNELLLIMVVQSVAHRGFGAGVAWSMIQRYLGTLRYLPGDVPMVPPGVYRLWGVAVSLRAANFLRNGDIIRAKAQRDLLAEAVRFMVYHGVSLSLTLFEPLLCVCGMLGDVETVLSSLEVVVYRDDVWPEMLSEVYSVLVELTAQCTGEREKLHHRLCSLRDAAAAQALYHNVGLQGACYLRDEAALLDNIAKRVVTHPHTDTTALTRFAQADTSDNLLSVLAELSTEKCSAEAPESLLEI